MANLTDVLQANPEVESVGMISMVPIRNFGNNFTRISVAGEPEREAAFVENRQVTPEYFATMGIPLIRGRLLTDRDTSSVNTPILINAELARQLFGDGEDIQAVEKFLEEYDAGGKASLDPLLNGLRNKLRDELSYESLSGNVRWFRPEGSPAIDK